VPRGSSTSRSILWTYMDDEWRVGTYTYCVQHTGTSGDAVHCGVKTTGRGNEANHEPWVHW